MGVTQDMCEYDGKLYAAWKGESGDDRIFYSTFDGTNWAEQALIGGNSSAGPCLANHNGVLNMGWKGEFGDERLFDLTVVNATFGQQRLMPGFASTTGPALGDFDGRLYAAWKGAEEDQAIWYSSTADTLDTLWGAQNVIPGVATSVGVSLCNWQGRLYAAWKGSNNDQGMYYASFDGTNWGPQAIVPNAGSSVGPAIAAYQEKVYAVWKGIIGDEGLYYSHWDGHTWAPQQLIPGVASSAGAALTGYGDRLFAMWKGAGSDQGLYFSSFDGQDWAAQQRVPGNSGPDAPTNIGMGIQYQETNEWCWLAVAASVAHFYNPASSVTQTSLMTQIGIAINKWPSTISCYPSAAELASHPGLSATIGNPYSPSAEFSLDGAGLIPAQCVKSGGVGDALNVSGNQASYSNSATLSQLTAEINARRPVCVDITWNSGIGSHVVAIAGILNDKLLILDPGSGETVVNYVDFPAQYGGGAKLDGYTFTKAS